MPPPADRPWSIAMSWHDLLFAHWPVPVADLRPLVPEAFEIDTFDGQAWIAVVPFHMTAIRHRLLPALPGFSAFPELNVRTYVRARDGRSPPGVYFFSLDAAHLVAVLVARATFHLNYRWAQMSSRETGGWIHYTCQRRDGRAAFRGRYRPIGPPQPARQGELDWFLTERYALYTTNPRGRPCVGEIDHPPWPLQLAEAEFETQTMLAAAGVTLPAHPPLLHFAHRLDVVAWSLRRL